MLSPTGLRGCKSQLPHLHPPPAAVDGVLCRLEDLRHVVRRPLVALLQRQLVDAAAKLVRNLRPTEVHTEIDFMDQILACATSDTTSS